MREYILTEKERRILKAYLEKGREISGFYMLITRARKCIPKLEQDLDLIKKVLKKGRGRKRPHFGDLMKL